jgi:hypothetical protein
LIAKDVEFYRSRNELTHFAFNPALGNVNDAVLSNSKYGDTHRFIGVASKNGNTVQMTNGLPLFHILSMQGDVLTIFMEVI